MIPRRRSRLRRRRFRRGRYVCGRRRNGCVLGSGDGRPHLEQIRPVFAAGKPVFVDKPLGGTLADSIAIEELGKRSKTPWFSSSSLRFGPKLQAAIKDPKNGEIVGCDAWSPCHLEP